MIAAVPFLEEYRERMRITHQTGKLDFERVRVGYAAAGWKMQAEISEYIDNMMKAFAENDLIVSRAGATTSFELMAAGKSALMIPLPGQLEQRRNAEILASAGAARMILQDDLNGERLAREISLLIESPDEITRMETAARKLARRDAAAVTVDLIEKLAGRRQ